MKKIKGLLKRVRLSCTENRDAIINATMQAQRHFSAVVFFTFLLYFLLISTTDYALWKTWNNQHLYSLVIAAVAAVNRIVFSKPLIARKHVLLGGDCFVLILLLLLAAGRSMGGGYVSYTLAVCTAAATTLLSLNPIHYSLLALVAMCSEIFWNRQFIGDDFVVTLYYGVDAFLIFAVTACLNLFFSLLRYQIFDETGSLKRENSVDGLTGLYNRKYLEHYFRFHHREHELSALIHIDLDNFKTVNDTLGHQAGDLLLQNAAKILRNNFRKSDCVARIGGDEFMIFMPTLPENRHVYERVRNLLENFPIPVDVEGKADPIPVSISVGVAFSEENKACSYTQLYEMADQAMYQAKKSGKGKAVFANGDGDAIIAAQGGAFSDPIS